MPIDLQSIQAKNAAGASDNLVKSTVQGVFNYMGLGLILTTLIAFFTARSPLMMNAIYGNPIMSFIVMLSPLAFVIYSNVAFRTASKEKLQMIFWAFCGTMGLSLSSIFIAYAGVDIFRAFAVSSVMFLSMSIYGITTKKDLTSMGSFMVMGLIGLIISMVINFFLRSAALDYVLSMVGVVVFMGLTAWDIQKVKRGAFLNTPDREKIKIMHALSLYLDFINLFLSVLRLQNR